MAKVRWRCLGSGMVLACAVFSCASCARLPYTTRVVYQDERIVVQIQQEVVETRYTHPTPLTATEVKAILKGFSIRAKKALPLRWFSEEAPPRPLFRDDELVALAPYVALALEGAGPNERVSFRVVAPGYNPSYSKDTTGGWIAVRDPYWFLTIEYFHVQLPVRKDDQYDYNFPLVPREPLPYLLYFEPGRFWVTEPATGGRALDFRAFLKSPEGPPPR